MSVRAQASYLPGRVGNSYPMQFAIIEKVSKDNTKALFLSHRNLGAMGV